ncbi:hypothetical protein KP509_05G065500 [Ceratopteris richardii]|uniref:Zinc-finger domain-containing protein n=1 Tax=Ceratopteris richardii TaxID=49495 RepID=A0A8T2UPJ8_CERRI|nr:hypothetical protein KP509_05G065500 [Ceratopteris richardii]
MVATRRSTSYQPSVPGNGAISPAPVTRNPLSFRVKEEEGSHRSKIGRAVRSLCVKEEEGSPRTRGTLASCSKEDSVESKIRVEREGSAVDSSDHVDLVNVKFGSRRSHRHLSSKCTSPQNSPVKATVVITRSSFPATVKKEQEEIFTSRKKICVSASQVFPTSYKARVKKESSETQGSEHEAIEDAHSDSFLGDNNSRREAPGSVCAAASEYESLRLQRIAENKARLAALGVQKQAESLKSFFSVSKPNRKPWTKSPITPIELRRRSERLKGNSPARGLYSSAFSDSGIDGLDRSPNFQIVPRDKKVYRNVLVDGDSRPGNAPLPKNCPSDLQVSPILSALRCRSKERGSLYDAIVGICCHFCRQKKLCGEEDCERCGNRDVTKPCLGKSDCSKCHSSRGVFCRACLKIRYGEDIEEVRQRGDWVCPHCSEEEGGNPYWICNSSICLVRRNITPTGIAIFKAREMGFKSVAHYLEDLLKKKVAI